MDGFGEAQLQAVREAMPDYLANVHGVTDLRRNFRCIHPGHEDRHPSMGYDARACRVKCFSCGASGDVFEVAGWDAGAEAFPDKVRAAASGAGIDLGECTSPCRPRRAARKPARRAPRQIEGQDVLPAVQGAFAALYEEPGAVALDWLRRRGFTDEKICRFGWGWVQHPSDIFTTGFERAPMVEAGYICLPFPEGEGWHAVRYATFRPCRNGAKPKEWKPKGMPSPVWREHLLRQDGAPVYIAEGIFDAAALTALLGVPACAMCGAGTGRVLDVAADTPPSERPAYVIATDADDAGRRFSETLQEGFAKIGAACSVMPPYPGGAKDAADVLRAKRVMP